MNILVTGAAGFLGSKLAAMLHEQDTGGRHRIFGLLHDRDPQCGWWSNLPWRNGNVLDYSRMLEIIVDAEIDQIYHMAAKSIVRNCKSDPIGCFQTNVLGTVNVLEAARQSERVQGIMCMESDKAYGAGPVPYREEQALRPGSVYEASKACVSHVCRAYYENYGLPVFTVRSANVYGPGDRNMTRLIPNTITRVLQGELPQITAGATYFVREFIYIDDFVNVVTTLMEKGPWGEAINVGSGETKTVGGVAEIICELLGQRYSFERWPKPHNFTEIPAQSLCLEKMRRWLPPEVAFTPLREGLAKTIEAHGGVPCST